MCLLSPSLPRIRVVQGKSSGDPALMDPPVGKKMAHVMIVATGVTTHYEVVLQILPHLSREHPATIVTVLGKAELWLQVDRRRGDFASPDLRFKEIFACHDPGLNDDFEHTDRIIPVGRIILDPEKYPSDSEFLQKELVALKDSPDAPTCIVSMAYQHWSADWAAELNIPWHVIFASPILALACLEYPKLVQAGLELEPESSGVISDVAGVVPAPIWRLVRIKDIFKLAPFVRRPKLSDQMKRSTAVVIYSSEEFDPEGGTLKELSNALQPSRILSIGPIVSPPDSGNSPCLDWLNSRTKKSVLYIAFGTIFNLTSTMVSDIATGIEETGVSFLWVLRFDERELSKMLPSGFLERTRERGRVETSFVPQFKILSHQAIGGFFTHAGWKSLMESAYAGVPVLAWPFGGDQFINVRYLVDLGKMGYSISDFKEENKENFEDIGSREVEKAVRYMMLEKGDDVVHVERNVQAMHTSLQSSVAEGGSSNRNLHTFLDLIANP